MSDEIDVADTTDGQHRERDRHSHHDQGKARRRSRRRRGKRARSGPRSKRSTVTSAVADSRGATACAAAADLNQPIGRPSTVVTVWLRIASTAPIASRQVRIKAISRRAGPRSDRLIAARSDTRLVKVSTTSGRTRDLPEWQECKGGDCRSGLDEFNVSSDRHREKPSRTDTNHDQPPSREHRTSPDIATARETRSTMCGCLPSLSESHSVWRLAHVPEKWELVFRKGHAQTKNTKRSDSADSRISSRQRFHISLPTRERLSSTSAPCDHRGRPA